MTDLVLNPATKKLLDAYMKQPVHALCLNGETGVGLGSIAKYLAESLAGTPQTVTVMAPEKGVIPIQQVRSLYEQTRSIQQGKRCIVIDDADTMRGEAQNALLKLLEEPAHNVHFILTTHRLTQLLPTIRSRTQIVNVLPVDEAASQKMLKHSGLSETEQRQALFLATGLPAELTRLMSDTEYFKKRATVVTDARKFLQASVYGKLVLIKNYTDRAGALEFLVMCSRLLNFSLLKQHNVAAAAVMEVFDDVMKRISANGHVRTQLMYLVTKLP